MNGSVQVRPPWIRGAEYENLALTQEAQAALWLHQVFVLGIFT